MQNISKQIRSHLNNKATKFVIKIFKVGQLKVKVTKKAKVIPLVLQMNNKQLISMQYA